MREITSPKKFAERNAHLPMSDEAFSETHSCNNGQSGNGWAIKEFERLRDTSGLKAKATFPSAINSTSEQNPRSQQAVHEPKRAQLAANHKIAHVWAP